MPIAPRCLWLALAVAACTGDYESEIGPPGPPTDTDDTDLPTGTTGATGETGIQATGDTAPPIEFDCTTIPDQPISVTVIPGARGYHGLAFDTLGNIIGSDVSGALLSVTYAGDVSVLVPGLGTLQSMDWLLDGDLVVASATFGALTRVVPATGGTSPIATDISAYGVIVGPNGMIYAADEDNVYRIDPATGVKELFVSGGDGFDPQSLNFSPDYSKFYMTSQFGWALWEMDLDANLEQASAKRHLADFGNSYRDGLAVDYCGNLYVPDYGADRLFRITPSGEVRTLVDFPNSQYGHTAVFGSGIGGWKEEAVYLTQPYDGYHVLEVEVGVPSRKWVF